MGTTTAAYSALQAIRVRKAQMEVEGPEATPDLSKGIQPTEDTALPEDYTPAQDADAIRSADPVERKSTAMSQMDQTAAVEGDSQQGNPMASMPGQQGGSDALAASNKTSAEGAAAVAQIEAMAGGGPRSRPAFIQSDNPYAASQMPSARGVPTSNLFKRQFRRF